MAIDDVYACKWKFSFDGDGRVWTPGIHVRQNALTFAASVVAANMVDFWNASHGITNGFKTWYDEAVSLDAILIRRVKPLENVEQSITTSLPIIGTSAEDNLTHAVSVLVSQRTAFIGRSYRARTYFPAPTEAFEDGGGGIFSANALQLADQFEWLRTTMATATTPLCAYSKTLDVSNDITSILVDRRFRSQRRRQDHTAIYVSP